METTSLPQSSRVLYSKSKRFTRWILILLTHFLLVSHRSRSLLTLLGCAGTTFCTVGFLNAFGVFQAVYKESLLPNESDSNIGWIGALNNFILFAGSLVTGRILDLFGATVCFLNPCFIKIVMNEYTNLTHHSTFYRSCSG